MIAHRQILIGIDTGGTYTDAVALDAAAHTVIATAKSLTTKGDLAVGVTQSLVSVLNKLPAGLGSKDVAMVSVSTTLATNAVVEGHGSPVAMFLIGFDDGMVERTGLHKAFPAMPVVRIQGGHTHTGAEVARLDLSSLEREALALRDKVSAFAVASAFAVRNPRHELLARDAIHAATGKPVTTSRELTSALDAPRRALTAALNARLISRISLLVAAVKQAMSELGIVAPLMVVRGDGTLAVADDVATHPIETVLSGPAASMIGAKWLSRIDNFMLSDIGGTTTDVGMLIDGRPRVAEQGAEVGGWRTMVQAIDVRTIGLGGDSHVQVQMNGHLKVGPQRAVPVSLLGEHFPETISMLDADLADSEFSSLHGRFVLLPFGKRQAGEQAVLAPREQELLNSVTERPKPLRKVAAAASSLRTLESLAKRGYVQLSGFTPSDAAHGLDLQSNWSKEAAFLGARAAVRLRDMRKPGDTEVLQFCRDVWSETVALSCQAILETAVGRPFKDDDVVSAVCRNGGDLGMARISMGPQVPVIAVGGPARVFYQEVERRLASPVVFVENFDVANAIGAAAGLVGQRIVVNVEGDGGGIFRVFTTAGVQEFTSGAKALEHAKVEAKRRAIEEARQLGASEPEVSISVKASYLPDAVGDDGLLKAEIVAEAVGSAVKS